ncbi:MAG TPA: flagellar biosynthesis protein FliQ [Tepidiformaceae bacterium]|nr:flagellar biosynthesis protein FliQ [Tepidiformaceae bacterium]
MNEATVIGLADRSLWVALQVGGPILGISLVVGVVISLIQAVTQVQEQTLTFVPKLAAVAVGMILLGPWMMETMLGFSATLFSGMAEYGR